MTILLIIGSIFIARFFFSLKNQKKIFVFFNMFFGVVVFLLVYTFSTYLSVFLFSSFFEKISFSNEIIISCFTIPFSVLVSGVHFKILQNKLKKKIKELDNIGK